MRRMVMWSRSVSVRSTGWRRLAILAILFTLWLHPVSAEAQFTHTQITNSTGSGSRGSSISSDGTRIAFDSDSDLTGGNADGNYEIFLAGGSLVELQASGSGPGPTLVNPVTVTYSVQGCSGKEMYLILNAPAMGIAWSYLSATGWIPLPADLATITPFGSGPVDSTYSLFSGTAPTGTYELYLGCDNVLDGHLISIPVPV